MPETVAEWMAFLVVAILFSLYLDQFLYFLE